MIIKPSKINLNINDISQSDVEVTFDEVLTSICNYYGLNRSALFSEVGKCWSKEEGKIIYFVDTSHHGSPDYEVFKEEILDETENRILILMDKLVSLLKSRRKKSGDKK